jgi:hypothetical protein
MPLVVSSLYEAATLIVGEAARGESWTESARAVSACSLSMVH